MKYIGDLYGKMGRAYIPLIMTSEDVDKIASELEARGLVLQKLQGERNSVIEQRDRLADALKRCQDNAAEIQKLRFGYDGDCGAGKIAEEIEDDCQSILAAVLK